ncbi:MAG: hypothetical protein R3D59_13795 [Paracoccaceae bacterium]
MAKRSDRRSTHAGAALDLAATLTLLIDTRSITHLEVPVRIRPSAPASPGSTPSATPLCRLARASAFAAVLALYYRAPALTKVETEVRAAPAVARRLRPDLPRARKPLATTSRTGLFHWAVVTAGTLAELSCRR